MPDYRASYASSRALVVGINSYSDPRFMPLGLAESDAQSFADLMAAPPYEFQITRLLGAQATKNAILQALFALRSGEPDDRILVYFAGHGYTLSDRQGSETGFLACADTIPEQDFTALKLDEVLDLTRQTDAKHACFIFDACFSGQALGLTRAASVPSDKLMERRAFQVLSAGAGDQTVADAHSMTSTMIETLRSGVLEADGLTTFNELGLYVQQTITRASNHSQIPQFGHVRGSQGGDFVFHVDTRVRLPGDLEEALRSSRANARLGAVVDLIGLAQSPDEVSVVARERLLKISREDADERVRSAAQSYFDEQDALAQEEMARERRERAQGARQITPPKMSRPVVEPLPDMEIAEAAPPRVTPPTVPAPAPAPVQLTPKPARRGVPIWVWGVVGVVMLGVIVGGIALVLGNLGGKAAGPVPTSSPGQTSAATQGRPVVHLTNPIAFLSDRNGGKRFFLINANGSGVSPLTNVNALLLRGPYWSPDGTRIAFLEATADTKHRDLYVMNADGSGQKRLTTTDDFKTGTFWTADSLQIGFSVIPLDSSSPAGYLVRADGSGTIGPSPWKTDFPVWSPDGNHAAVETILDSGKSVISIGSADLTGLVQITNSSIDSWSPSWSPDSRKIVFASSPDSAGTESDIYVVNADGSGLTQLTSAAGLDDNPSWSPDGTYIAFASNRDGNYEIYMMDSKGYNQMNITNDSADDTNPKWQP